MNYQGRSVLEWRGDKKTGGHKMKGMSCLMVILFLLPGLFLYIWAGESPAKESPQLIMYNGGPLHTGVYKTKPLLQLKGLKWKFQADNKISSEPAVYKGIVYFNTIFSHLYAIDAKTGKQIWNVNKEGMVYSRPVIAGNVLYFGSGDFFLYALDAKTSKELWKFKAANMAYNPTVWQGMVFFGDATGNTLYALH